MISALIAVAVVLILVAIIAIANYVDYDVLDPEFFDDKNKKS